MRLSSIGNENYNNSNFHIDNEYNLFYKNILIDKYTSRDEANAFVPDLVIGPNGIEYFSDNVRTPYDIFTDIDDYTGDTFYKATNNIASPQIPGFCSSEVEDIKQYLPGGSRNRHYGGGHLISFIFPKLEVFTAPYTFETANSGLVLMLPGSLKAVDFGSYDGVALFQEVMITVLS